MEINTKYSIKERLPTLDVDKALLKSVENYVLKTVPNLIDLHKDRIKENYTVRIVDIDNELTLNSIDSYEHDLFPSNTTEIEINFRSRNTEKNILVDFRIKFAKERFSSKIELEVTALNPKEVTIGVLTKLREIFDQKKNHNWLFQPSLKFYPIMIALMLGMAYLSTYVFGKNRKWGVIEILFNLLIVSYLFLFSKWKPYVSFDTRVQRNYNKWATVFLWGIPSFLVFGIALPKIIDFLIGK